MKSDRKEREGEREGGRGHCRAREQEAFWSALTSSGGVSIAFP